MLRLILTTVWLLLPAYTPNNFAVIFGGGTPIDLGRKFIDGKRILGDGKTIRGFIFGVLGGLFVAHIQLVIERFANLSFFSSLEYHTFLVLSFSLSFGALFGDSFGSFIKRRFGVERGASFPLLDQLSFIVFALLFASRINDFWKLYSNEVIITGFILTPLLHLATNFIAYRLGIKKVPW